MRWTDLAFQPDPALAEDIRAAWQWLLPGPWTPFLCAMVGGIFLEDESGVYWLDSSTALVERVADDRAAFDAIAAAGGELVDEWFLPPLIERLHEAGKQPGPGQCYAFITLPVFEEGRHAVENMFVAPVREQFVGMAAIHEQLKDVPDGGRAQLKTVD